MLPHSSGELLLLGTEDGHVFIVEVPGFREVEEKNISVDQVSSRSVDTNEAEFILLPSYSCGLSSCNELNGHSLD